MKDNIGKWAIRGLISLYLPPYSPELNIIEILWKFMRYYLIEYVKKIFDNYGDIEYSIDFSVSRGVIVKSRLDVAREIMFVFWTT